MRILPGILFLFHSWDGKLNIRGIEDIVVNIALYVPLGLSAHLAFRRYRVSLVAFPGPVLLGGLLSALIGMTQLFVRGRHCSTMDLLDNVVGSALGVLAGVMFERIAGPKRPALNRRRILEARPRSTVRLRAGGPPQSTRRRNPLHAALN
jgi:hypothetical protein